MRRIPLHKLVIPPSWLQRATAAKTRVATIASRLENAPEDQIPGIRQELRREIARHSGLWAEIKESLAELSFKKCWYCESRENRSDMAVDHFRPKNKVFESQQHHGYWWLALDPQNYRYACDLCNSPHENEEAKETLGKGTHFPLVNEDNRLFSPMGNLDTEKPRLLDPARDGDPSLLWFHSEGSAVPKYPRERSELFNDRAECTIRIYNLNDIRIKEERLAIAKEIQLQVARGDRFLDQAFAGDNAALELFKEAYRVIGRLIAPDAEFSSAARAVLATFKDKDWVEAALTTV
jgi:uncharacterized protein (TIGR02646 family)